ncbi:NU153 protein, partial [Anseranas semipalmata]|nr:NU153 protein [Anseranas semipalmata]
GIISRVTESVKNIVPGWLQKYFNKGEDKRVDTKISTNQQNNPVNDHRNSAGTMMDGKVMPQSARMNMGDPSTSRSALNFSAVLTRPSLHRSYLNSTVSDSTVPPCQPSTSSTLGIGSPGISLVKEIKDSTSQHDDDNNSTTSGFSSRASDKDTAVSRNTSAPLIGSTDSFSQQSASSSKKPSFNISAFGLSSPTLGNTSLFKTSKPGDSAFYSGKTTYGGAAAATTKQAKLQIGPYQTVLRRQMKAKQASVPSFGVISTTARHILKTLEKMSSPLMDAKRIPSPVPIPPIPSPVINLGGCKDKLIAASLSKMESQPPPVQKLMTPKIISRSRNQTQHVKQLRTSANDSRKIYQRVDAKDKGMQEKSLPTEQKIKPPESNLTFSQCSTATSNGLSSGMSFGGKMRRERGIHYVSRPGQEQQKVEEPVLPKIPLPINTASLRPFNFSFFPTNTVSSSSNAASTSAMNTVSICCMLNSGSPEFRFSSPIVKSTEAEVQPPPAQIGFTFSVPVVKSAELSGSSGTPVTSFLTLDTTTASKINNVKEEKQGYSDSSRRAMALQGGPARYILKNPDFTFLKTHPITSTTIYTRPAITTFSAGKETSKETSYWQSDTCDPCPQNKDTDNKYLTCQTTKLSTVESTKQTITSNLCDTSKSAVPTAGMLGFGDKFKTAPGTWDCDTCLVRNKPEVTKCIACETPKPGTGVTPALTLPVITDSSVIVTSSSNTDTTITLDFGDKFKKPKGSWDCAICLVSNKTEDNKCVACQSEKPGSPMPVTSSSASAFSAPSGELLDLDKFKKPEGSWDCETCLVRNKAEATKCVACESAKPGTKADLKGFGTATASTNASLPSFTFGVQSSSPGSSHTLDSTGSFKFGEQGGFKFGIASESASSNTAESASSSTAAVGFKFPSISGDFKFGISCSDSKSEESKKEDKNNSFTFGLSSTSSQAPSTFQFGTASLGQQEKKEEPVLGGFSFGTSSTSAMATNKNKTGVSGFAFGTIAEKEVVSASFAFKKSDEKKDEAPSTKGGFSFGSAESAPASQFVLGRTEEKQDSVASAAPLVFGKKADNEESKAQPVFSVGKSEHIKEESTAKPIFNFSFVKPSEKETEQGKPAFSFGVPASTSDQGAAKPSFSFLSSGSSSTAVPTTSANSSNVFGSVTSSSNPTPVPAPFVFGQASNTVSSSAFGNSAESTTSQSFGFSQENKPATTSSNTGVAVAPFVFGSGASSSNASNSGFTFGATSTSSSTGSSSSFVFGSGSSAPAAGPAFGASQPPAFGQSQGSGQPNAPSFGSLSTTLFSAGSQPAPPAFGSVTSSTQPPVFGQQASQQPGFGSGTSSTGPVFQFGSNTSNFNFPNNPGVFTFGANPTAPTAPSQPSGSSGFSFSQPPAFTVGTNGKNIFSASGSSVSGRKIKTAVRRRK